MKKKSIKKIDSEWMQRVNDLIAGKFCTLKLFSPAQINLLVFGSEKFRVMGFGSYEALIVAIRETPKHVRKPFLYLKALASNEEFINECNKKIDVVKPSTGVLSIGDIMKKVLK